MSVFQEFESIVASIPLRQAKDFIRKWRGKMRFTDAQDVEKFKQQYIDDYAEREGKEEVERSLRQQYGSLIEDENTPEHRETVEFIESHYDHYVQRALEEGWDLMRYEDLTLENANDPEMIDGIMEYVIYNHIVDELPGFKAFCEKYGPDMKKRADRAARIDAFYMFNDYVIPNLNIYNPGKGQKDISHLYDPLFGRKERIELDIKITAEDLAERYNQRTGMLLSGFDQAQDTLIELITEYYNLQNNEKEASYVRDRLSSENENETNPEIDYINGKYTEISGKKKSIGSMLDTVKKQMPDWKSYNITLKDFIRAFNQRPTPFDGKIIISRHPYDIAGMSTGRGWTSCMNLDEGMYKYYVESSLMHGVLIAYLTKANDTIKYRNPADKKRPFTPNAQGLELRAKRGVTNINLQNPTSRLLIKPYVRKGEEINTQNPNFILLVSKQYGTEYDKFKNVVQKWLNDNWNYQINDVESGNYVFNSNFYQEDDDYDFVKEENLRTYD